MTNVKLEGECYFESSKEKCFSFKEYNVRIPKTKYGALMQKFFVYVNDQSSYYWTSPIAVFYSEHELTRFLHFEGSFDSS